MKILQVGYVIIFLRRMSVIPRSILSTLCHTGRKQYLCFCFCADIAGCSFVWASMCGDVNSQIENPLHREMFDHNLTYIPDTI